MTLLPKLLPGVLLVSIFWPMAPTQAVTLGWWRMGDDDGFLFEGQDVDSAAGIANSAGTGIYGPLAPGATGLVQYSSDVPAASLFDPLSGNTIANNWSMQTDGSDPNERVQSGSVVVTPAFSYETFLKFDSLAASAGVDFAYQRRSISGGWVLELQANGTVRAVLQGTSESGTGAVLSFTTPLDSALSEGTWHHVGLVFEGNSTDGSNDTHLYLNRSLVASANFDDSQTFGGSEPGFPLLVGSSVSQQPIRLDEARYFDSALALDGSDFLRPMGVAEPLLVVDRITGSITLQNNGLGDADFNILGYSLTSGHGALDPDGWKSIAANYDSDWTIQSFGGNDLISERDFVGDGFTVAAGESLVLSQGSGTWLPTPIEDLEMEVTLTNGVLVDVPVVFTGNGGNPLSFGDLNHDGTIDQADFTDHLLPNFPSPSLASSSSAIRYLSGDLNRNGQVDAIDVYLFRNLYEDVHGAGSFAAMWQGLRQVPEPSSIGAVVLGMIGAVGLRKKRRVRLLACTTIAMLLGLMAAPAHADTLGWWRMGDDDGGLIPPPVSDGQDIDPTQGTLNPTGTYGPLVPVVGATTPTLQYSTSVPATTIYDPLGNTTRLNSWALSTDGSENLERVSTPTPFVVPTSFSYETFVRVDDIAASAGLDFALHSRSISGGWRIGLLGDGTLRTRLQATGPNPPTVLDFATPADMALTAGRWYHVGLIFEGNSTDGSNDTHVYIDGQLAASANFDDTATFGGGGSGDPGTEAFPFFTGVAIGGAKQVLLDEERYFDTALALDGSDFLQAVTLRTTVNTLTGEIRLVNDTLKTIELANYQITSPQGRLLTGDSDWNSLSDQGLNPVGGGNDPGETWEEGASSDAFSIGEAFLLGSTPLAPGEWLSLGNAYLEGAEDTGLTSFYHDLTANSALQSIVEFITPSPLPGDYNTDGVVNAADYVVWRNNLNGDESVLGGNGDGSGVVDAGDYTRWKENYGRTAPGALGTASSLVPEPGSVILLLGATAALFHLARVKNRSLVPAKVTCRPT